MNRRDLLRALGLGSVGLTTGIGVKELIGSETKPAANGREIARSIRKELQYETVKSNWVHPELDNIETFLRLTGGYPNEIAFFRADQIVVKGDQLNINYNITMGLKSFVLYRTFNVTKDCTVIGTSIQGPVVRDYSSELGHRLATLQELQPDEEKSREYYSNVHIG